MPVQHVSQNQESFVQPFGQHDLEPFEHAEIDVMNDQVLHVQSWRIFPPLFLFPLGGGGWASNLVPR